MKTTLALLFALAASGCARQPVYVFEQPKPAASVTGKVLSVTPEVVLVQSPVTTCSPTTYYHTGPNLGTVAGAVVGGAAGSTVGAGTGRDIAIAAGAIVGAAVGHTAHPALQCMSIQLCCN